MVSVIRLDYDKFQWFTPAFIGKIIEQHNQQEKRNKKWEYFLTSGLIEAWGGKVQKFDTLFMKSAKTGKVIQWQEDRHNIKN